MSAPEPENTLGVLCCVCHEPLEARLGAPMRWWTGDGCVGASHVGCGARRAVWVRRDGSRGTRPAQMTLWVEVDGWTERMPIALREVTEEVTEALRDAWALVPAFQALYAEGVEDS